MAYPSGITPPGTSADQTSVAALEASSPLSGYSPAPFTSSGVTLLTNVSTFLISDKLTKTPVDVTSWEVPSP